MKDNKNYLNLLEELAAVISGEAVRKFATDTCEALGDNLVKAKFEQDKILLLAIGYIIRTTMSKYDVRPCEIARSGGPTPSKLAIIRKGHRPVQVETYNRMLWALPESARREAIERIYFNPKE
jgi:hypothetical protein